MSKTSGLQAWAFAAGAAFALLGCSPSPGETAARAPGSLALHDAEGITADEAPPALAPAAAAAPPPALARTEESPARSTAPAPTETAPDAPFRQPLIPTGRPPASRFAELSPAGCMKELTASGLAFTRSKQAAGGVATPVRSSGPLHGVRIVIPRAPSPFGVLDCRLALALGEMARIAKHHGVVQMQVDNTHRTRAKLPRRGAGKSQHAYGLAADVTVFRLEDGRQLSVATDWHAPIGSVPCGPDAHLDDPTPAAVELRNLVCALARGGVFHHLLTPSFDAAHRDHLHLDIKRGEKKVGIR